MAASGQPVAITGVKLPEHMRAYENGRVLSIYDKRHDRNVVIDKPFSLIRIREAIWQLEQAAK